MRTSCAVELALMSSARSCVCLSYGLAACMGMQAPSESKSLNLSWRWFRSMRRDTNASGHISSDLPVNLKCQNPGLEWSVRSNGPLFFKWSNVPPVWVFP